jgi:hypothetical protein
MARAAGAGAVGRVREDLRTLSGGLLLHEQTDLPSSNGLEALHVHGLADRVQERPHGEGTLADVEPVALPLDQVVLVVAIHSPRSMRARQSEISNTACDVDEPMPSTERDEPARLCAKLTVRVVQSWVTRLQPRRPSCGAGKLRVVPLRKRPTPAPPAHSRRARCRQQGGLRHVSPCGTPDGRAAARTRRRERIVRRLSAQPTRHPRRRDRRVA